VSTLPQSKKGWVGLLTVVVVLTVARPASADTLFVTSVSSGNIFTVDTATHVVTPAFNVGPDLDSLIFDPSGRIIYSALNNNIVGAFNPMTNSNVTLASSVNGVHGPIDLALDPSKTSFLVSNSNNLLRVSLAGGVLGSPLSTGGLRPDGIIYDTSGRLFVNVSTGFTNPDSQLRQIDPTTGAVIKTTGNTGVFLDGLTFDNFTGKLFASDYNNGRIVEIDPDTLAFTILTPAGGELAHFGPDGITSDGKGDLFIASRGNGQIIEFNIASNTATPVGTLAGIDDLAPASGLGAPEVPEPSSLLLAVFGGFALLGYRVYRKRLCVPG
jgi:streptogramin lyase